MESLKDVLRWINKIEGFKQTNPQRVPGVAEKSERTLINLLDQELGIVLMPQPNIPYIETLISYKGMPSNYVLAFRKISEAYSWWET